MATRIDKMPAAGGKTPPDSYAWELWFFGDQDKPNQVDADGCRCLYFMKGVDYQVLTASFRAYAYRAAKRLGVEIETVMTDDRSGLTIKVSGLQVPSVAGTGPAGGTPVVVR